MEKKRRVKEKAADDVEEDDDMGERSPDDGKD